MALPIEPDPFESQHPEFPVAMGHRRTALGTRSMLLSAETPDRSVRGNDSVAWDEWSERVIRKSGAD